MNFKQQILDKTFIRESILYYSGKIAPGLGGLLIIPIVVRYFGTETYGEYTLYFNAILFLGAILTGWINQSLLRFYGDFTNPSNFENILGRNLLYSLLLIIPILFVFFSILSDLPLRNIIICAFVIVLYSWYSFNLVIQQVRFNPSKVSFAENIRAILFLGMVILGIYLKSLPVNEKSTFWLLTVAGIAFLCGIFIINGFKALLSQFKSQLGRWTYFEIGPYFKYGFPLTIWFIFSYLVNWSDRYIISFYFDLEIVGRYSAIYDLITKLFTFLYGPILLTLQPHIFSLFSNGKTKQALRTIRFGIVLYFAIFLLAFIILVFLRSFILENILGFSTDGDMNIIIPLLLGSFSWNLAMLVHKPLELRKQTTLMLIAIIFAFALNLIGNLLFIPSKGYVVAAYTTLISSLTYLLITLLFSFKREWRIT